MHIRGNAKIKTTATYLYRRNRSRHAVLVRVFQVLGSGGEYLLLYVLFE